MKITIELHEEKFTYECEHASIHIGELTEKLCGLCVAAGYHPDAVGECFHDKGREMTEHLYKDDNIEEDEETALEFDKYLEPIVVKSRHGDERKFTIIDDNVVEYSFKDDGHIGCSLNDDDSLHSIDPSGGPYIGVETDLGVVDRSLKGLIVTKIEADLTFGGKYYLRVAYLTVEKDNV